MKVTRQNLIELCDNFLGNKIDKTVIQNFASTAISDDDFEWDEDEIISDTIFEWDNEDINFEINKTNVSLWKKRLLTERDDLLIYNNWNSHIDRQKEICEQNNSTWKPINKKLKIGVSTNLEKDPINGLRHPSEKGTTGWFIWTGEYSEAEDFFLPICAEHLLQQRPEIIKYLGLDIGYRFLADSKDYEDIWYDEKLKKI
ncbi:immunity protein Imm33 domain-containing protein [Dyadobacter diqingensis]|uniref:immunity protein Imm33 domain-containing protein n=1 Tax=Dyadobacter diqingensis TaxID=2938121 RepID=UPI0020C34882|nr:hypothetical protein [Dyadobacter diqingensis]